MEEIYCLKCDKYYSKVYVISQSTQEFDLVAREYGAPEVGDTINVECESGHTLQKDVLD